MIIGEEEIAALPKNIANIFTWIFCCENASDTKRYDEAALKHFPIRNLALKKKTRRFSIASSEFSSMEILELKNALNNQI